jgi:hypothetical protein
VKLFSDYKPEILRVLGDAKESLNPLSGNKRVKDALDVIKDIQAHLERDDFVVGVPDLKISPLESFSDQELLEELKRRLTLPKLPSCSG